MRRIWVDRDQIKGNEFTLTGDPFHHAAQVIRLRPGEKFEIVTGESVALISEFVEISKKSGRVKISGERVIPPLPKPYIHLALSIPKWSTFEWVLEKCVEMGVASVQPLISDFSFVRQKRDITEQRISRLRKIIVSATEQSARGEVMLLKPELSLTDFIRNFNQSSTNRGLFAYEGPSALSLASALKSLDISTIENIWLLVGSEGGFSGAEVEMLKNSNWPPFTIGNQILRVDTACLALLSVIKYECGLMRRTEN